MKLFKTLFSPAYGYFRAATAFLLGILLVLWPDIAAKSAIQIIGGAMIIIGGISILLSIIDKESHVDMMMVNGIFDILLGIVICCAPSFFLKLIIFVFGAVLLIFGIGQLANLLSARRAVKLGWGFYVIPAIVTAIGVALFFRPLAAGRSLFLLFGIVLLFYGVSELMATIKVRKAIRIREEEAARYAEAMAARDAEDVEYEEVKEDKASPAE